MTRRVIDYADPKYSRHAAAMVPIDWTLTDVDPLAGPVLDPTLTLRQIFERTLKSYRDPDPRYPRTTSTRKG